MVENQVFGRAEGGIFTPKCGWNALNLGAIAIL